MRILAIQPQSHGLLAITAEDGRTGLLDVRPYLEYEAFWPLRDPVKFNKVSNGGYFIGLPPSLGDFLAAQQESDWPCRGQSRQSVPRSLHDGKITARSVGGICTN